MIRQDFNRTWLVDDANTAFQALQQGTPGKEMQVVHLPHDSMIMTKRNANNPMGGAGGFFEGEDRCYRKTFFAPKEDKGKVYILEFDGVYMNATVKVNGEFAGKYAQGYSNFLVRINDYIKWGQDNEVSVAVINSTQPNSRWYTGTGIYRNVRLLIGDALHICPNGLQITTLDATPDVSVLRIDVHLHNESSTSEMGYIATTIRDAEGCVVTEERTKFHIRCGELMTVEQTLSIKNAELWCPDTPVLHSCEVKLTVEGTEIDYDCTTFGIRKLQLDAFYGLRINGFPIKLKGGCIHHDNGVLGAATFEDAEERRVILLKQAGYNAIRSAHNPASCALLDACDKHGMLVMDEYSDVWTSSKNKYDYAYQMPDYWEKDIERFVLRGYNHPSIIMYSVGNEIPENGMAFTAGYARKMARKIRTLDSTRYVTNGINPLISVMSQLREIAMAAGAKDGDVTGNEINEVMTNLKKMKEIINQSPIVDEAIEECCSMVDVVGYNYSTARFERDHQKHPHRIFVGSETYASELDINWKKVEEHPYVLGDFSWTAWDYLGEAAIGNIRYADTKDQFYGSFPWVAAWCGDFDLTGYRRPVSYWREIIWGGRAHKPFIAVQKPERYGQEAMPSAWSWTDSISSWTWPGFEEKKIIIEVYSDADEVDLRVNGTSLGRKTVGDDFKPCYCKWDTYYQPGMIEAIAFIEGMEVGRFYLKTAEEPLLTLSPDKHVLRAGTNDLCYINVELVDKNGTLNTAIQKELTFSVEGAATIQGSGSANPTTDEDYFNVTHKTFYGRAIAVLRAQQEKGIAKFTVSAEGMEERSIEILVE